MVCNRITWGRLLLSLASCTPSFFPFSWFSWLFASFPCLAMQFLIQEKQLPFCSKCMLKILLKITSVLRSGKCHFTSNQIKIYSIWESICLKSASLYLSRSLEWLENLMNIEYYYFPFISVFFAFKYCLFITKRSLYNLQYTFFKPKITARPYNIHHNIFHWHIHCKAYNMSPLVNSKTWTISYYHLFIIPAMQIDII